MKIELRHYIVPSIPIALMLMVAVTVVWFSDLYIHRSLQINTTQESLLSDINSFFSTNIFISNVISLIITAFNAFLIGQLNNKFTIIRTRSFLPILFFVLLMATWHETHPLVMSHLALTLVLVSFFSVFRIYRNLYAAEEAFLSSSLIALASIFVPPLLLYIPLIWVGLLLFYSMSLRNFLATIVGVLTPWILFLALKYYLQPDLRWLSLLGNSFEVGFPILNRPLNELVYIAFMVVLSGIAFVCILSNLNQDSMQTRGLIHFNSWFVVLSFGYSMVLAQQFFVFLPFTGAGLAILLAHPITLNKSKFYTYLFVTFIAINIIFVISNLLLISE